MVRQQLEPQARRRTAGVSIVGDEISATYLDRIHANLCCRQIDQSFGYRTRDGMTHPAVLAHHILVLKYDTGAGAIVLRYIWAADQIDDLVRFDGAGARIHR